MTTEVPTGPVPCSGNDDYNLGSSWSPSRGDVELIQNYLVFQPEQSGISWVDHCESLAAGILKSIDAAGKELQPKFGLAHWIYNDAISVHVPCCSQLNEQGQWCGNGPLLPEQIATGDCGDHA